MKLPNWFKIIWWMLLLVVITYYLAGRYSSFMTGDASTHDIVVFLFWVSLCILPLIQEIDIFGFKVKKEIDEIKSHVDTQVESIRTEIRNSVEVRTQLSQNINIPSPAPDNKLLEIEERVKRAVESEFSKREGGEKTQEARRPKIDPTTVELFEIRYLLESELNRIWKERFQQQTEIKHVSTNEIIRILYESDLIDRDTAIVTREIYAITTAAIHGSEVSGTQYKFVLDTFSWASDLLKDL